MKTIQITPQKLETTLQEYRKQINSYDAIITSPVFSREVKRKAEQVKKATEADRDAYLGAVERGSFQRVYVIPDEELINVRTGKPSGLRYNDITGLVEEITE